MYVCIVCMYVWGQVGSYVVSTSGGSVVHVTPSAEDWMTVIIRTPHTPITCLHAHPSAPLLAVATISNTIQLWNYNTREVAELPIYQSVNQSNNQSNNQSINQSVACLIECFIDVRLHFSPNIFWANQSFLCLSFLFHSLTCFCAFCIHAFTPTHSRIPLDQ